MKRTLISLMLTLAFALTLCLSEKKAEANVPLCKNGIIWSERYGCEPPPAVAPPAWYEPFLEFIGFIIP